MSPSAKASKSGDFAECSQGGIRVNIWVSVKVYATIEDDDFL